MEVQEAEAEASAEARAEAASEEAALEAQEAEALEAVRVPADFVRRIITIIITVPISVGDGDARAITAEADVSAH